jgi:hypothetical protein
MRIWMMAACCVLGMGSVVVAQTGKAIVPAAGTIATPAVALDSELSLIEGEMMSAVKVMPAEKFGFAPSAGIFVATQTTEFATVRTFAQQATHVAQANYFMFGMMSGLKPDVDVRAIGSMTKKDDIVAALSASYAFGHKAIATLTPTNAFEVIKTPEPGLQTKSTFAGFAIGHCNDHYGQMVEYLRMNGLVPPASAK